MAGLVDVGNHCVY